MQGWGFTLQRESLGPPWCCARVITYLEYDEYMWHICQVQLHFYLPDDIAEVLRARAQAKGLSLSRFLADMARREVGGGWPDGYFSEIVGGWKGQPLERAQQSDYEIREPLGLRLVDE